MEEKNNIISSLLKKKQSKIVIEGMGIVIIVLAVLCSICMNIVGRTLWLDEAMLAISFNTRSFIELFKPPLAWNQSAPVGYLVVVKIITLILGNAEWVYRLFSIVAYMLLLWVFYQLCKRVLHTEYPILCTAGLANIAYLLEYSNMFKPYICDALCVTLVLLCYSFFQDGKCKAWQLSIIYAVLIWCSNPVAFMSGGVVAYEVLTGFLKKNKNQLINGIVVGIAIVVSFLVMYVFWLAPTLATTNLSDFWEGYQFPILWTNWDTINEALGAIKFVTEGIGPAWKIILILSIVGLLLNIFWKHNPYVWSIMFAMIITLVASNRGYFPMSDRLFLFCIPIFVLLAYFSGKWLIELLVKVEYQRAIAILLVICFVLSGTGISRYHTGEAYVDGEEANEALDYLEENVEQKDMIYVYYPAIPIFMYRLGYDTTSVCGYTDNVILGKGYFYEENQNNEDIQLLAEQTGVYLLFSHVVDYQPTDRLMDTLNTQGSLEKVKDQYLFYYSQDKSNYKGKFSYELLSQKTTGDLCIAKIAIHNEGMTYLNNGRETYYLHTEDYDISDIENGILVEDIAPGETIEVTISFNWKDDTEKEVQLYDVDKYAMKDVGVKPLVIQR